MEFVWGEEAQRNGVSFGTKCPEANIVEFVPTSPEMPGLGRLPNKQFRGASGPVKIAGVTTPASLAQTRKP